MLTVNTANVPGRQARVTISRSAPKMVSRPFRTEAIITVLITERVDLKLPRPQSDRHSIRDIMKSTQVAIPVDM